MPFTYSYEEDGANKTVSQEELSAAFDLAFVHLDGGIGTPVSISGRTLGCLKQEEPKGSTP